MNVGIVISRYARALLKYVTETGDAEAVCAQAQKLSGVLTEVPDLEMVLGSDQVNLSKKQSLLETACGAPLEDALLRLTALLEKNGRLAYLRFVLVDFVRSYRRSRGIRTAVLRCVTEPSEEILDKFRSLVKAHTGEEADIRVVIDPDLIGGFVFDIDDWVMDGSVSHALEQIRVQFIEKNRRIV